MASGGWPMAWSSGERWRTLSSVWVSFRAVAPRRRLGRLWEERRHERSTGSSEADLVGVVAADELDAVAGRDSRATHRDIASVSRYSSLAATRVPTAI